MWFYKTGNLCLCGEYEPHAGRNGTELVGEYYVNEVNLIDVNFFFYLEAQK